MPSTPKTREWFLQWCFKSGLSFSGFYPRHRRFTLVERFCCFGHSCNFDFATILLVISMMTWIKPRKRKSALEASTEEIIFWFWVSHCVELLSETDNSCQKIALSAPIWWFAALSDQESSRRSSNRPCPRYRRGYKAQTEIDSFYCVICTQIDDLRWLKANLHCKRFCKVAICHERWDNQLIWIDGFCFGIDRSSRCFCFENTKLQFDHFFETIFKFRKNANWRQKTVLQTAIDAFEGVKSVLKCDECSENLPMLSLIFWQPGSASYARKVNSIERQFCLVRKGVLLQKITMSNCAKTQQHIFLYCEFCLIFF